MKIAFITEDNIEMISGGYLYDRCLVKYLERQGDTVKRFVIGSSSMDRGLSLDEIKNNVVTMDPDLIIEDELSFLKARYLNNEIRKDGGPPIIALVHHLTCSAMIDEAERERCMMVEKEFIQGMDGFIFNSQATKDEVMSIIGSEGRAVVAYPGKDHLVVRSTTKSDRAFQRILSVVYIGNILPHKGLDVLIRALATMEGRDFKLTVIGVGPDVDYVLKVMDLIISNDLGENIVFLGRTDERTLSKVLEEADVLAGPSYFEGYGISYVEALGYGVPVIATTSGGAKEIISDGVEGFLVPPGDHKALTDRLNRLMDDPSLAREMSKNALKRYSELPYWNESMEQVRDYLISMEGSSYCDGR